MATGSAWAGWTAVAGEDAECPLFATFPLDTTALQPSPQSLTAGVSGALALNDEEMEPLWDAVV
jgi:hypothetical protein